MLWLVCLSQQDSVLLAPDDSQAGGESTPLLWLLGGSRWETSWESWSDGLAQSGQGAARPTMRIDTPESLSSLVLSFLPLLRIPAVLTKNGTLTVALSKI